MAWKDMCNSQKGGTLFYAGVVLIVAAATIFSLTFLILAVLLTPWFIKVMAAIIFIATALIAVGAYMQSK